VSSEPGDCSKILSFATLNGSRDPPPSDPSNPEHANVLQRVRARKGSRNLDCIWLAEITPERHAGIRVLGVAMLVCQFVGCVAIKLLPQPRRHLSGVDNVGSIAFAQPLALRLLDEPKGRYDKVRHCAEVEEQPGEM
jgi:hypothetical protein